MTAMRPFTIAELRRLADIYCSHEGIALSTLSKMVFPRPRNDAAFIRLANGLSISAKNAEVASRWLVENWPSDLRWPKEIPAPAKSAA